MRTLQELQRTFPRHVGRFLNYLYFAGYEVAFGEAFVFQEDVQDRRTMPLWLAKAHMNRLAINLVLYRGGQPLPDPMAIPEAVKWWKSLDKDCCWGGDNQREAKPARFYMHFDQ